MNVTNDRFKDRQLHIEDYLQMVPTESKEYWGETFSESEPEENKRGAYQQSNILDTHFTVIGGNADLGYIRSQWQRWKTESENWQKEVKDGEMSIKESEFPSAFLHRVPHSAKVPLSFS